MRYAILSDTGGHHKQLVASLQELGVDLKTHKIPADLTIIHLGDLVHKGPHSDIIVSMVDALIRKNRGRWVQLFGNHELHYFPDAPSFWNEEISEASQNILMHWHREGLIQWSYSLPAGVTGTNNNSVKAWLEEYPNAPILLSHSGVSYEFLNTHNILRDPSGGGVEVMCEEINVLPFRLNAQAGLMLYGETINPLLPAGPAWAEPIVELWYSWARWAYDPRWNFLQVHGHTNFFNPYRGDFFPNAPELVQSTTLVDVDLSQALTLVGSLGLLSVDPCYGKSAPHKGQPFLLLEY